MANTGIRQLTTVVGGYAKRIWYSLNGTTPTAELMSIDDAGNFKCISQYTKKDIKNVKFYGATGDGIADDTTSINNAISELSEGEALYFPAGKYKVTNTLTISNKNNITVLGSGATIENYINDNSKNIIKIEKCNEVEIKNIKFDLKSSDLLTCLDIYSIKKGLNISNLSFFNFKNHAQFGIKLENIGADVSSYYTPTYTISKCNFYNSNSTAWSAVDYNDNKAKGTGIFLSNWSEYGSISDCNFFKLSSAILNDGGANTVITSNNFYMCGQKPSIYSLGSVIYMRNNAGNYAKNIISNNNFNHNYYYCIYYSGNSQILTISNNNFIVNMYSTLGLINLKNSKIQNNYFENCNNYAGATNYPVANTGANSYIVLYDSSRNLISGNVFKDNLGAKNAIESLSLSDKNTILNNTYQSLAIFLNLSGTNNIANNYDVT